MKSVADLTLNDLQNIVADIQEILWHENNSWEPAKEWDSETIALVAEVLEEKGLRPDESEVGDADEGGKP